MPNNTRSSTCQLVSVLCLLNAVYPMGGDAHQGLVNNTVRQRIASEALQVANQFNKLAGILECLNLHNRVSKALRTVECSEIVTALDLQDVVIKYGFLT